MPSYIIFHPDKAREWIKVDAEIIKSSSAQVERWSGTVFVDKVGKGNEDPWCITQPWLYSYCHATQLRRSQIRSGDILFFISGDQADNDVLSCDTLFVVDEKLSWQGRMHCGRWTPSGLPFKLEPHRKAKSAVWSRHLRYGIGDRRPHSGRYTFTAKPYCHGEQVYSFLPLMNSGVNTSFAFADLPAAISRKMLEKRRGRFPALLETDEASALYELIFRRSERKVVNILETPEMIHSNEPCGGC